MEKTLYYLHTLSALHIGIGQGSGVIDLPIARERATQLPQVPGSSVKGVLRSEYQSGEDKTDYLALFGPESGEEASKYAGALAVGDGRLLALPVRSWCGTFAWATCPLILQRYQRDLKDINATDVPENIPIVDSKQALCTTGSVLIDNTTVYLEDLDLTPQTNNNAANEWADYIAKELGHDADSLKSRFLILADDVLDFLAETATEIRTRIRIDPETNTVKPGALWTEEYLPAESLLWGVLASDRARNGKKDKPGKNGKELLDLLQNQTIQLGGNATTGGGQTCWIKRGSGE